MSSKKTIKINPQLFSVGKQKMSREKKGTRKEKQLVKPNSLKKELMKRIKTHANNLEKNKQISEKSSMENSEFDSDFDKHLNYLTNLSKQKRKEKMNNRTRKKPIVNNTAINPRVYTDLPNELNNSHIFNVGENQTIRINKPIPEPPYGCIKGGDKPTFKEWKRKTQKNVNYSNIPINMDQMDITEKPAIVPNFIRPVPQSNVQPVIQPVAESVMQPQINNPFDDFNENVSKPIEDKKEPMNIKINPFLNIDNERERKMKEIKEKFKKKNVNDEMKTIIRKSKSKGEPRRFKYNKTVKRTYGKGKGKVSVCIKDSQTRKNIIKEQIELRKKPISEVKDYLRKKYLIKMGSHAPNEILRKIYEEVHLTGEVTNKSEENLIHNYINDSEM